MVRAMNFMFMFYNVRKVEISLSRTSVTEKGPLGMMSY
jgi:hypothetical protein